MNEISFELDETKHQAVGNDCKYFSPGSNPDGGKRLE